MIPEGERPRLAELLRGRNCVLVAHPDDETLWAGGLMLAHPGDWTVICCSIPRKDPIRAWKFYHACERLGARGRVIPAHEPEYSGAMVSQSAIESELAGFRTVVTHGAHGEYGHPHHQQLFMWMSQRLRNENLLTFCTHAKPDFVVRRPMKSWLSALRCYDHVLPYEPLGDVPKWQALRHRYGDVVAEGFELQPTNHWHALADMAREHGWTRGAELGVRWGANLFNLLYQVPDLHMTGVDLFEPQPDNIGPGKETYEAWPWDHYRALVDAGAREFGDRVTLVKGRTVDAAKDIEDGSLDFVFIDADHSYEGVLDDIEAWTPKIRKGGYVTGHDIHMDGVRQAVEEAFPVYQTEGWRLNYVWWAEQC